MSDRVYCAYFDHNYLSRGLALYHSLQRFVPGSRLWVLCLSDRCYDILARAALPLLIPVRLSTFEQADPQTAATRSSRKPLEYYFTCTPGWMLYVAAHEAPGEWITYLDGDLYFFASPEPIYAELADAAVAIVPHRFTRKLRALQRYGTYNVGWVGARNLETGLAVLHWWRERCIEWCFDYADNGRFADQGYLDQFQARFVGVAVIRNPGANLAPWNIGDHRLGWRDGQIVIDGATPLVFFHFQGLRKAWRWFFFNSHRVHRAPLTRTVRDHVYRPYVDEVLRLDAQYDAAAARQPYARFTAPNWVVLLRNTVRNLAEAALRLLDIATRRAFVVIRGKAY